MIKVTMKDGHARWVNVDHIISFGGVPVTIFTSAGTILTVRDTAEELIVKIEAASESKGRPPWG
jgi:uncharacterized protein YlzI (FlbEa/FlbD family)